MYIQSQYQVKSFDITMNQVTVDIPFFVLTAGELWSQKFIFQNASVTIIFILILSLFSHDQISLCIYSLILLFTYFMSLHKSILEHGTVPIVSVYL